MRLVRRIVNSDVVELPLGPWGKKIQLAPGKTFCGRGEHTFIVFRLSHGLSASTGASSRLIGRASKIATDGGVNDELVVGEMRRHVAAGRGEVGRWCAPGRGIGFLGSDICGNRGPGEAPDLDASAVPQVRIHPTCHQVELLAIALRLAVQECAAAVVLWAACALVIDDAGQHALFIELGIDFAAGCGVQGVLVGRLFMDSFKNVDLATAGPVRSDRPVRRPDTASMRH